MSKMKQSPKKQNQQLVKPTETKDVTVRESSMVSTMLSDDAGAGMETIGREDVAIPRLTILQSLSPQLDKKSEDFIPGAEAGMIMNTVTGEVYSGEKGVHILAVNYRVSHLEWYPRASRAGKGFVADHGPDPSILDSCTKNESFQWMTKKGTEIIRTAEYFVFLMDMATGNFSHALLSMAKSQLKKSKGLNTIATTFRIKQGAKDLQAPLFYRTYLFRTRPESNEQGNWYGWEITPGENLFSVDGAVTPQFPWSEQVYMAARSFREKVATGKVKVSSPVVDPSAHASADTGDDSPM